MSLETERLAFRPPRLADAAALFEFLGDDTAMQYTTVRESVRDCRRYIAAHERQRRRIGCAPWVIIEKQAGRTIGVGGVYEDPFDAGWLASRDQTQSSARHSILNRASSTTALKSVPTAVSRTTSRFGR